MSTARLLRPALVLTPVLGLVAAGAWFALRPPPAPPPGSGGAGRLVVLAVFDQMRGDYPARWADLFGPDGFRRMERDGVWYADAHIPYALTETGPGHASIATGAPPSRHGIIANEWYDPTRGKRTYCVSGNRPYARVPSGQGSGTRARDKDDGGLAPDRLLSPTTADALRAATGGKGRVFSLALKDRAAVLMGGKEPTGCYCFDTPAGEFITSTYYRERPHPWVEAYNQSRPADKWAGKSWDRLEANDIYAAKAGPDDAPGEAAAMPLYSRTFPHPLGPTAPGPLSYAAVEASPFGNDLVWSLAKAAIEAENLGRGEAPDLLCLGFSANDLIGHVWGPDSQEVLDVTLRSDRLLADMFAYLDARLGRDHYTLVVTADHGVCPLPEAAGNPYPGAARFDADAEFGPLAGQLDNTFGRRDAAPGRWLEAVNYPWLTLNHKLAEANGIPPAELNRFAAEWAGNRGVSQTAIPREVLAGPPATDPITRAAQLSFHPDRAGDVYVIPKLGCYPRGGRYKVAAGHGSPHPYDTFVPVLAVGVGVPAGGKRTDAVSSLIVAPLVCRALGVPPPAGAQEPLPPGWGGAE